MLGLAHAWWRPLFDDAGPVVVGPPPPPPPSLPAGLSGLVVAITVVAMLWWIVRWASRRFGVRAKHTARIGLFGAAIGNALMDMAAMLQPDRPTAAQIERVREARPDGAGAGAGPDHRDQRVT